VPSGDVSFWQAALRDPNDELYAPVREAIASGGPLSVDLLYGDHEGGQRTITRFYMIPRRGTAGTDAARTRAAMTSTRRCASARSRDTGTSIAPTRASGPRDAAIFA